MSDESSVQKLKNAAWSCATGLTAAVPSTGCTLVKLQDRTMAAVGAIGASTAAAANTVRANTVAAAGAIGAGTVAAAGAIGAGTKAAAGAVGEGAKAAAKTVGATSVAAVYQAANLSKSIATTYMVAPANGFGNGGVSGGIGDGGIGDGGIGDGGIGDGGIGGRFCGEIVRGGIIGGGFGGGDDFYKRLGKATLYTAGASLVILGGAAVIVPAIGFGSGGVGAATWASAYQSAYLGGVIAKGSAFATMQSVGAAGLATTTKLGVVGVASGVSLCKAFLEVPSKL